MYNLHKHEIVIFAFLSSKDFSLIVVSIYKGLLEFLSAPLTWDTFSACLIDLDNLREHFGCSTVTAFMSIVLGFSKALRC